MAEGRAVEPIDTETAMALRQMLFGTSTVSCKMEWISTAFVFNPPETSFSCGLIAPKGPTKGIIMCLQAYVLKNLLFQGKLSKRRAQQQENEDLMDPSNEQQQDVLKRAFADIIWKCGAERGECIACIDDDEPHLSGDINYSPDGITEKLSLYTFRTKESLMSFIQRRMDHFQQEDRGAVLKLVYSALLSRGIDKVKEDQSAEQRAFVSNSGELHVSLLSLLLTGMATAFLHNGMTNFDDGTSIVEQIGICCRSEIGLLYYKKDDDSKEVGSRMKTPMFPVWVAVGNEQYGVLFNPNRDLLRDHKAEHVFNLLYYSSTPQHSKTTVVTLDTRSRKGGRDEDLKQNVLEKLIRSKWEGATVDWNGAAPAM